ncbi:hypothetical protein MRB53_010435 [Persea americana]|uniref:Uncharacterized protein n=1 Tax=Persea americana TaxID=3435 RepID=A0ACC2LSK1_PERAE|nr:hypothetical protein MRB53_010435 [Persea americana]
MSVTQFVMIWVPSAPSPVSSSLPPQPPSTPCTPCTRGSRQQRCREADDPPTSAAHQAVRRLLGAEEGAPDIDDEDVVPVLLGDGSEVGVLGVEDAGAVDEDVGLGGEGRLGLGRRGI